MIRLLTFILTVFLFSAFSANAQTFYYKPYSKVTNQPVGGEKDVERLFFNEFQYPSKAIKSHTEGSVTFAFILHPNGEISDLKIKSSSSPIFNEEATRVFKKIQWSKNDNRPTHMNVRDEFTVEFNLKKWVKLYKKRGYQSIAYPVIPIDSTAKVYFIKMVEVKPEPVFKDGNYNSFNHYISKKMRYPEAALKLNLKGEVVVAFVIEPSGKISNIDVRKAMNGGCTQEALRLIKNVDWIPGQQDGKAVRTQMITAIGFGMISNAFHNNYGSAGN